MLLILNLLPVEPLLIKVVTSIYKRWTIPSLLSGLASISFMNEVCIIARIILKVVREYDQELPQSQTTDKAMVSSGRANNHETPGRKIKQSNQLSLPHRNNYKTRMDTKQRTTRHRTITRSHNGSSNQQRINNNRSTPLERTSAKATRGLKCILLVPNLRSRFCCC